VKREFFIAIIPSILGVAKASCTKRFADMLSMERKKMLCVRKQKKNWEGSSDGSFT
jgi:hypothetical protein